MAFAALCVVLFTSCAGDYRNAIPKGSVALLAVDAAQLSSQAAEAEAELCKKLQTENLEQTGIDFSQPLYGFETTDGTLGMVAAIGSESKVEECLNRLAAQGEAEAMPERKGHMFWRVAQSFLVGKSGDALMVTGPVLPSDEQDLQRRMAKWLDHDDGEGISDTQLYAKLEETEGALRLVARGDALPPQLTSLFTLGAPKGTKPQQLYLCLALQAADNGTAHLTGGAFSFDAATDKALKEARSQFVPIEGKLLDEATAAAPLWMACGVKGDNLLKMLRAQEFTRSLLFGANTAIDIDKMLRSVNGDMTLSIGNIGGEEMEVALFAQTSSRQWLADVDYWKKSCPQGTTLTTVAGDSCFRLTSKEWSVNFGFCGDGVLFLNNRPAIFCPKQTAQQGGDFEQMRSLIRGKRLVMAFSMPALLTSSPLSGELRPLVRMLTGDARQIIYTIE